MSNNLPLIDVVRRDELRQRAIRRNGDFFLHDAALAELEDRISLVNKNFSERACVSGFVERWTEFLPDFTHVRDDDTLELPENSFDLVCHSMALHSANDPVGQLIQCNRALKPDGLFLGVFFADQTLSQLRACLAQAESEIKGGLSPRILPMGDIRDLGGLMQRAGFALPVADKITIQASYDSLFRLAKELRDMGEGNALHARNAQKYDRKMFQRAEEIYRQNYAVDGRLIAQFDLVVLTGWAPSKDQPKPLRPGSAQQSLASALKTSEIKL